MTIKNLQTLGKFSIEEVLPYASEDAERKEYTTDSGEILQIKMQSLRYRTFQKSLICVCCGIEGKYMALQRFRHEKPNRAHFNLYGINEDGKPVLITKDHIVPRSSGGPNHISNMQTMCTDCNGLKNDLPLTIKQLQELRQYRIDIDNEELHPADIRNLVKKQAQIILQREQELCDL